LSLRLANFIILHIRCRLREINRNPFFLKSKTEFFSGLGWTILALGRGFDKVSPIVTIFATSD
jgi:hypothetical protein